MTAPLQPRLPLFIAAGSTWTGTGVWLTELLQPGNDVVDAVVFQAFAANFLVIFALWVRALYRQTGANA